MAIPAPRAMAVATSSASVSLTSPAIKSPAMMSRITLVMAMPGTRFIKVPMIILSELWAKADPNKRGRLLPPSAGDDVGKSCWLQIRTMLWSTSFTRSTAEDGEAGVGQIPAEKQGEGGERGGKGKQLLQKV